MGDQMTERHALPFRSAPILMIALLIVAIIAFWPGYFGALTEVSGLIHFH